MVKRKKSKETAKPKPRLVATAAVGQTASGISAPDAEATPAIRRAMAQVDTLLRLMPNETGAALS